MRRRRGRSWALSLTDTHTQWVDTVMRGGDVLLNTTLPLNTSIPAYVITVFIPIPPEWTGGEIAGLSVSLVFITFAITFISMMAYSFHVYDEIDKEDI
jgi:hypothetical protein